VSECGEKKATEREKRRKGKKRKKGPHHQACHAMKAVTLLPNGGKMPTLPQQGIRAKNGNNLPKNMRPRL
jgi:hypothetical protein